MYSICVTKDIWKRVRIALSLLHWLTRPASCSSIRVTRYVPLMQAHSAKHAEARTYRHDHGQYLYTSSVIVMEKSTKYSSSYRCGKNCPVIRPERALELFPGVQSQRDNEQCKSSH